MVLDHYHQQKYYKDPLFHFSFGWDEFENVPIDLPLKVESRVVMPKEAILVNSVLCKIGNKVYNILLT